MNNFDRRIRLSAIQVHWSRQRGAFAATSDQFPGVTHCDECSLAALDGFIDRVSGLLMPDAVGIA
ncbi:hypothetical protein KO481_19490 [Nocardia sp. NEAU-G5]|uniref:DUF1902 domain-containing protein n=1 Tax=Nocardia albiluteola TaxID=2842303 RepID=A0ABS6B1T1_9NOCA|nr:hypothetical protein [Nocardia albiluteola]MBU3063706.1 hypothetical protein [Nocardia albiluteola]